ncbi:hypothetical protein F511_34091 [Dorcoceras hygrometricum]|uniref:Uncharacterized protein n=1 Tax=Dorcoceras hygrometricum TaxID=472368 RepID=A0A2Z7D0W4_9LAMI|nr:hypothetical protein F511_34091 [Dorcoceras hygrometricum]
MSSMDDRVVVEFVQSLGSPSSSGAVDTSNPPVKASRRKLLARINAEEAILSAEGSPWYEVKASLLQESDKALIRDLSGMSDQYEILIPLPKDRDHLPPEGYHTFYINQLEMGLRFPVPGFIQNLCDHLKVSPSQLTPNSYSSLLALGVLLKFYQAPLSLHLICKLTQIRQQDVGKFFICLKPVFGFIKGNPSSHKGWMSRCFFLRRNVREGIAWYCDMSWSEKPTKRILPPPAQECDPTPFLKVACAKCFNAHDLVRDDLLCHFGFSRKGVVVEGDLADRIMKSYLLEAYKKQEAEASRGSNPPPEERAKPTPEEPANPFPEESANPPPAERTKEKRRKSSLGAYKKQEAEASRGSNPPPEERAKPTPEEPANPFPEESANPPPAERTKEKRRKSSLGGDKHSKKKKTSSSVGFDKEAGTSQLEQSSLEVSSFIAQPVISTTVAFFRNFVPELDLPVVNLASDKAITEALASNFLQFGGGELYRRVSKARETARSSRRSLDEFMVEHNKLMKEIEDVREDSDAEKKSLEQKLAASEASVTRLQEEIK